jgi:hypothetical protein
MGVLEVRTCLYLVRTSVIVRSTQNPTPKPLTLNP